MLKEFTLKTEREGLYNITTKVAEAVRESGAKSGLAVVYCPHTTAGITINENADPDVCTDLLLGLSKAFPDRAEFRHGEGNSAAHLKSSCVGASQTVIISPCGDEAFLGSVMPASGRDVRSTSAIESGRLLLGTWQGIYFCEFDGPRSRKFFVKVMGGQE